MTINIKSTFSALMLVSALSGCVHHHHHDDPDEAMNKEHHDAKIVVVHKAPAKARNCRKHRRHWHCKR
ncbi:MAG: hypothetical protein QF483_00940 [Gammaproteobacteria bacterium]|jgi:hypothetical protein|nr:hypothetical protein [Chromatiales bacterium]MCP4926226.1 hypothetical protein [Gammaproteobacteria bacterium]MDP7154602.1 hypothetical protein [Gammaproteobacteria bacterium]MDP7296814.1 hypothetical protein [Gammaproteobacteria bacterium]MDP7418428.1 hypothetical protein [Gammaproteobacteria bacterium]